MLVIGHSISNAIDQEYRNLGIIKTMGARCTHLRAILMIPYTVGIVLGIILGVVGAILLSDILKQRMVGATGIMIPTDFSVLYEIYLIIIILGLFLVFMFLKTRKLAQLSPMAAIREKEAHVGNKSSLKINEKYFLFSYAVRQISSKKKRYLGVLMVSFILVFLIFTVGKMNQWLGPNGEGLMNSFSVARHDLGVQPKSKMDLSQVEQMIKEYANIEDTYELAMQNGTVNGKEYTINVLDEPSWFHILKGKACETSDEVIVTEYVATDLSVTIGDTVQIASGSETESFRVVGIYSCANGMGANVGMNRSGFERIGDSSGPTWCKHYILSTSRYNDTILKKLQERYPMDLDVHTNSWSGLDSIISTMRLITMLMYMIVGTVIVVVVSLTSGKLLQMEQKDITILMSQGLTGEKIRLSFSMRMAIVSGTGTILGICFASLMANELIQVLLTSFGISDFSSRFSLVVNVLLPGIVIVFFSSVSYLCAGKIKRVDITGLFRD